MCALLHLDNWEKCVGRYNNSPLKDNILISKFFLLCFFCFYVLSFIIPQPSMFIIRISPLVVGVVVYIAYFLFINTKLKKDELVPLIFLTYFCLLASIYLIWDKGVLSILSMENFFFLSLPLFFIVAGRLNNEEGLNFTYKFFLYFIYFQLFVIIGQSMKMLTGIGFNTPAEYTAGIDQADYENMLSGTFLNSNDLASLVAMIAVFFLLLKHYRGYKVGLGLIAVFVILILTASRMSILLFAMSIIVFWFCNKKVKKKKVLLLLPVVILILASIYNLIDNYSNSFEALNRVKQRVDTIFIILNNGISSDNSMSIRFESYLNFIDNLDSLGYGTMKFRDYGIFVNHLGAKFSLLAVNPHSFIVEIGYWMGWLGLSLFLMFMISLFIKKCTMLNFFVFVSFILITMISSSVISNFLLFFCFFCCALIYKESVNTETGSVNNIM